MKCTFVSCLPDNPSCELRKRVAAWIIAESRSVRGCNKWPGGITSPRMSPLVLGSMIASDEEDTIGRQLSVRQKSRCTPPGSSSHHCRNPAPFNASCVVTKARASMLVLASQMNEDSSVLRKRSCSFHFQIYWYSRCFGSVARYLHLLMGLVLEGCSHKHIELLVASTS